MHKVIPLAVISAIPGLLLFATTSMAQQGGWTGNINVFLGAKALDEDDWAPVDEHSEIGIELDFRPKSWPVNIAVDYLFSKSDKESFIDPSSLIVFDMEAETSELNIGIRKIWEQYTSVRPFIGGGLSFIRGEAEVSALGITVSESGNGAGIWIGGGVYWTLIDHLNLGLELKFSTADISIAGVDVDAGGGHFGFLAGYHW